MFEHGFPKDWSTLKKLIWLKGAGIIGAASEVWKTATGAIASFFTQRSAPLRSLVCAINPVQDLHGYDAPWPAGGGKNLFNKDALTANTWIVANGTGTESANGYSTSDYIPVVQGTVYYAPAKGSGRCAYYDSNKDGIAYYSWTGGSAFTAQHTGYMRITLFDSSVDYDTYQFEVGNSASSYAPYSNECPIYGHAGVDVTQTGFNVWDEQWEEGTINATTGNNQNGSSYWRTKNYIPVKPNTAYLISATEANKACRLRFYDKDQGYIGTTPASGTGYTGSPFTTPLNAYFLRFAPDKAVVPEPNGNVSVNYPSTDTSYHAYTGTTIPITFPDEAGTVYVGTLDVVTGVLTNITAHIAVDENTNITKHNSQKNPNGTVYDIFLPSKPKYSVSPGETIALSNVFTEGVHGMNAFNVNQFYPVPEDGSTNQNCIRCCWGSPNGGSTLAEFKTFLINNNAEFVYELAETLTFQLSAQEVDTLVGQNNVWNTAGDTTAEYLAN